MAHSIAAQVKVLAVRQLSLPLLALDRNIKCDPKEWDVLTFKMAGDWCEENGHDHIARVCRVMAHLIAEHQAAWAMRDELLADRTTPYSMQKHNVDWLRAEGEAAFDQALAIWYDPQPDA